MSLLGFQRGKAGRKQGDFLLYYTLKLVSLKQAPVDPVKVKDSPLDANKPPAAPRTFKRSFE